MFLQTLPVQFGIIFAGDYRFGEHVRWQLGWPNPNYAAAFLATLIPWLLGCQIILRAGKATLTRRLLFPLAVALECAIWILLIKTYSRGGIISALCATALFLVQARSLFGRRRIRSAIIWRIGLVVAAIFAAGFNARLSPGYVMVDRSATNRLSLWRDGLEMMGAAPFAGWGSHQSGSAYRNWYQSDGDASGYSTMVNSFLTLAVEHGVWPVVLVLTAISLIIYAPQLCTGGSQSLPLLAASAAARSAVAGWVSANCFTTLWSDWRLWVVPAVSASLASYVLCRGDWHRLRVRAAFAFGLSALIAALTYWAGVSLWRQESVVSYPTEGGTIVVAVHKGGAGEAPAGSGSPRDWDVWPDRDVLGPWPGKPLRNWLRTLPFGSRLFVHSTYSQANAFKRSDAIMLFGGQVERLSRSAPTSFSVDAVWLVHPRGTFGQLPSPKLNVVSWIVVLPEIDLTGESPFWLHLIHTNGYRLITSIGSGIDIRAAWPSVVRQAQRETMDNTVSVHQLPPKVPLLHEVDLKPQGSLSEWPAILARFYGIDFNGNWRGSYNLGSTRETEILGLQCDLKHRLSTDSFGRARTHWTIPALVGYLVPEGPGFLRLQAPNGTAASFRTCDIMPTYESAHSERPDIRQKSPLGYEIRMPNGVLYAFENGRLAEIQHPVFGHYCVSGDGGVIRKIDAVDGKGSRAVFAAEYDLQGNLVSLRVGANTINRLMWKDGELVLLERNGSTIATFAYDKQLLSRIAEPGKGSRRFEWAANPGFGSANSYWREPVRLVSDGLQKYQYEITGDGFRISVRDNTGELKEDGLYNPLRRRLWQRDGKGNTVVVFFYSNSSGLFPERIEDGSGHVLEQ
jgi:hypothetical protein